MIHKEYDKYIYDLALKRAVNWLIELEIKRGILINGNFSKAAKIYGCKVRDVRAKYNTRIHMFNYIANNSKHLSIIGGYVISINEYDVCYAYKLHTDDTLTCISYCKMQDSFYNEYGDINLYRVYDFLVK